MISRSLEIAGFVEVPGNDERLQWRTHKLQRQDSDFFGLPAAIEHRRSGLILVLIPGGTFTYGVRRRDPLRSHCDRSAERVELSAFYLGESPVTQGQWYQLMGKSPSRFRGDARPVESVTKDDALRFLQVAGSGLRLPTEVEWERAARGGTRGIYWWGDRFQATMSNCLAGRAGVPNRRATTPVHRFERNPFGLLDVLGNVWEWSADERFPYVEESQMFDDYQIYHGSPWSYIRGGSWRDPPALLRCSERMVWPRYDSQPFIGFRVARNAT